MTFIAPWQQEYRLQYTQKSYQHAQEHISMKQISAYGMRGQLSSVNTTVGYYSSTRDKHDYRSALFGN